LVFCNRGPIVEIIWGIGTGRSNQLLTHVHVWAVEPRCPRAVSCDVHFRIFC
jgi:hypothetical protein